MISPVNNKFNVIIKTAAAINDGYIHHFGVNEETLSVEGEAIKEYITLDNKLSTKYSIGLHVSSMTLGSVRYFYCMNKNQEFEGEMLAIENYKSGIQVYAI